MKLSTWNDNATIALMIPTDLAIIAIILNTINDFISDTSTSFFSVCQGFSVFLVCPSLLERDRMSLSYLVK